ncbi:transmembrane protein, putative [Medicago truncatula]|uniref:Transmembrane protein, putative n=1 Tax=Medicago truncatula TaxID=3880 RepID=G7IUA1_MEDTR|nr:transmembrane protein, putative [Medicago truncatula]
MQASEIGLIAGVSVGVVSALVLARVCCVLCSKRKRLARQRQSKTWIPLSVNGAASHTMGSKYSNGTTISVDLNLQYRVPFAEVQESTNNFDDLFYTSVQEVPPSASGVFENDEMILVYEYMEKGTLKSHQYGSRLLSLSWPVIDPFLPKEMIEALHRFVKKDGVVETCLLNWKRKRLARQRQSKTWIPLSAAPGRVKGWQESGIEEE